MGVCIDYYKKENLEKLHTKQLLKMRKSNYIYLDMCECCNHRIECLRIKEYNKRLLKEILSTRPHIMNKKESKAYRKAKIHEGK